MDDPMPQDSALRRIDDDPASRKKFLKMVGAGGAGALALLLAACGDDDRRRSSNTAAARLGQQQQPSGASGSSQFGKGDVGIAKYALTLEYLEADFYKQAAESGMLKGAGARARQGVRRARAGARRRARGDAEEARREAAGQAEGQVPARLAGRDPRTWPRPSRTSAPPPTSGRPTRSRIRRSWPPRCRSTRSRPATPRR